MLTFEQWRALLLRAAALVRQLHRSAIDGDALIARIDSFLYEVLDQPLPLFLSMYDVPEHQRDFSLRPSALEDGAAFLTKLAEDARPWALPPRVTSSLVAEAGRALDELEARHGATAGS